MKKTNKMHVNRHGSVHLQLRTESSTPMEMTGDTLLSLAKDVPISTATEISPTMEMPSHNALLALASGIPSDAEETNLLLVDPSSDTHGVVIATELEDFPSGGFSVDEAVGVEGGEVVEANHAAQETEDETVEEENETASGRQVSVKTGPFTPEVMTALNTTELVDDAPPDDQAIAAPEFDEEAGKTWFGMYTPEEAAKADLARHQFWSEQKLSTAQHIQQMNERYYSRQRQCQMMRAKRQALRRKYVELRPRSAVTSRPKWNSNTALPKERTKRLLGHQIKAQVGSYSFRPRISKASKRLARRRALLEARSHPGVTSESPHYTRHTQSTKKNVRSKVISTPRGDRVANRRLFGQVGHQTNPAVEPSAQHRSTPGVEEPDEFVDKTVTETVAPPGLAFVQQRRDSLLSFQRQVDESANEVDRILEDFSKALYLPLKAGVIAKAASQSFVDRRNSSFESKTTTPSSLDEMSSADWAGEDLNRVLDTWYAELQRDYEAEKTSEETASQ